jgi:hypothetical protein
MKDNVAPIVLFVYNRPMHTRQTVEALKKNLLSKQSNLIIFSDAPRTEVQEEKVKEVRQYIRQINGFKSVNIIERETNFGLARSIIEGVSKVIQEHGRVIVLEDDLQVSPYFLDFMNSALDTYENEDKVMHISGYMFPIGDSDLPETFFLRGASCWGWATWTRAWKMFEPGTKNLLDAIRAKKLEHEFDMQGTVGYTKMLENQFNGDIDSWAVRWYASVFLNEGNCLHPARSLVNNIGHDGTGVHCGANAMYEVEISSVRPIVKKQDIKESFEGLKALKRFYSSFKQPFYIRIYTKLSRLIKNRRI